MGTDSNLKVYNQDNKSEFAKLITENLENIILKDNSIVTGSVEKGVSFMEISQTIV